MCSMTACVVCVWWCMAAETVDVTLVPSLLRLGKDLIDLEIYPSSSRSQSLILRVFKGTISLVCGLNNLSGITRHIFCDKK